MTVPATARDLVYSVLRETLPTAKITDSTKLSDLGYDVPSLAALAARINARNWHGVHVSVAAVQRCEKVSDVITVVNAAQQS